MKYDNLESTIDYSMLYEYLNPRIENIITIIDKQANESFTYLMTRAPNKYMHFVKYRYRKQPNRTGLRYLGVLFPNVFTLTRNSFVTEKAPAYKLFKTVHEYARLRVDLPKHIVVLHDGRCGRCNRRLTSPESLRRGFGPICINEIKRGDK